MNIAFAGDRDISVEILTFIISKGVIPKVLMVSNSIRQSHADELKILSGLSNNYIIEGNKFKKEESINLLKSFDLDYIIGIHFPYLVPKEIIDIPKFGFLNLHPAFLPYNKGWHTPSWAILDKTPVGGTLHYMTEKIDSGDIIHQKQIEISYSDTANTLYKKIKQCEVEIFKESWEDIIHKKILSYPQNDKGSEHLKNDLFNYNIQVINLNKSYKGYELIDKMRALTTSDIKESSFFIHNNKKYRIQINITEDEL